MGAGPALVMQASRWDAQVLGQSAAEASGFAGWEVAHEAAASKESRAKVRSI